MNELHEKEKYNQDIVNDHIELKHTFEIEERVKQEENEVIRQNNFQIRSQIRQMCSETSSTVDQVKKEYFINSEEFTIKFRE